MKTQSQPIAAGDSLQNSDAYRRTYEACQAGGLNNTDSHEMAMEHARKAAGEAAHYATIRTKKIGGAGTVIDDSAELIIHNKENAEIFSRTFSDIVRACNSHAALVEALKDAQQALAHAIYRLKDDGQFSTSIALKGAEEKARAALASATS